MLLLAVAGCLEEGWVSVIIAELLIKPVEQLEMTSCNRLYRKT